MLSEKDRRKYLRKLRAPNLENLTRKSTLRAVNDTCKKVVICPFCEGINGMSSFYLLNRRNKNINLEIIPNISVRSSK